MSEPVVRKSKRHLDSQETVRYVVFFENKLERGKTLRREFLRKRDARRFASQVRR